MERTTPNAPSIGPKSIIRRLIGLIREMAPIVLFFFIAFGLIFLLFKLFVAQYSIEFSVFSEAAVAALILGKLVPLLDWAQSGFRTDSYRPAMAITVKTIFYGLAVFVFGIAERLFTSSREAGSLSVGFDQVASHASLNRSLGLVLLLSLVIGAYLVLQEINRAMGKGALLRLFFQRPPSSNTVIGRF